MELPLAAVYWFTQLLGATIAALALRFIFPSQANLDGSMPQVNDAIELGPAVLTEAILTFSSSGSSSRRLPIPAAPSSRSRGSRSG